jgi:hypothetical protein
VSALSDSADGGGVLPLESVSSELLLEFHDLRMEFESSKRDLRVADRFACARRLQIARNVLSNAAFYKDSSPEYAHMCRVKVGYFLFLFISLYISLSLSLFVASFLFP